MHNAKLIAEENKTLLEYRYLILQQSSECNWLFRQELEFVDFLKSLNTNEVKRIGEIDYPLFELDLLPRDISRYSAGFVALESIDLKNRLIYESNLLILANRWRISQDCEPDEIRYNTKEPLFAALKESTFLQIQLLAFQAQLVSKFSINLRTLKKLVVDESLTRVQRNRIVINS